VGVSFPAWSMSSGLSSTVVLTVTVPVAVTGNDDTAGSVDGTFHGTHGAIPMAAPQPEETPEGWRLSELGVLSHELLVVRFIDVVTYQATPRSNLFQRKTTGEALNSLCPSGCVPSVHRLI